MLVVGLESRYKVDEMSDAIWSKEKARIVCFEEEQTDIWNHFCREGDHKC